MTTTDTDALTERIAEAAYRSRSLPAEVGMKRDYETTWAWTERMGRAQADQIAAAVLPIVAVEVRKAKAEAWDEGWKERSRRDIYRSGPLDDSRPVPGPPRSLNPYRETGDSDEH